jgi:predicted nucleic acid-binding protein
VTLVDTSVWIDWLRKGNRPATILLDRLIDEDDIVLAGVIVQELLAGALGAEQLAELRAYFEGIPILMPSRKTYADAGALYARCRWAGVTPRSPHDCLIAQTAMENGVPLLHDDRDFDLLATVEPKLILLPRG